MTGSLMPQEVVQPAIAFPAMALMYPFHSMSDLHVPSDVLLPRRHEAAYGAVKVVL
jgi:hypothetical protein